MADPNFNIFSGWSNWWDTKVGDPMRDFIQRGKDAPMNHGWWEKPPTQTSVPASTAGAAQADMFTQLLNLVKGQSEYDYNQAMNPLNNLAVYTTGPDLGVFPMAEGGPVPFAPVQTEEGEKILLPDMTLTDVAAKKKHKDMNDDEVTDVAPQGSYVFSARTKLKKKNYEGDKDIVLFKSPTFYDDSEPTSNEYELKFSELFNKSEMTAAELAEVVKKKFPVSGRKSSAIDTQTDARNKESMQKVLEVLIGEVEKNTKRKESKANKMPDGGYVSSPSWGENFADLLNYTSFISPVSAVAAPFFKAKLQEKRETSDLNNLFDMLKGNLGNASLMSAMGLLAQDQSVPRQDFGMVNNLVENMPTSYSPVLRDYLASQVNRVDNTLFANTTNYNTAARGAIAQRAAGLDTLSKNAIGIYEKELGLKSAKDNARLSLAEAMEKERLGAANQAQSNRNRTIAGLTDVGTNYINQSSDLDLSKYQTSKGIQSQIAANKNAQTQQNFNNLFSTIQMATSMASGIPKTGGTTTTQTPTNTPTFFNQGMNNSSYNLGDVSTWGQTPTQPYSQILTGKASYSPLNTSTWADPNFKLNYNMMSTDDRLAFLESLFK